MSRRYILVDTIPSLDSKFGTLSDSHIKTFKVYDKVKDDYLTFSLTDLRRKSSQVYGVLNWSWFKITENCLRMRDCLSYERTDIIKYNTDMGKRYFSDNSCPTVHITLFGTEFISSFHGVVSNVYDLILLCFHKYPNCIEITDDYVKVYTKDVDVKVLVYKIKNKSQLTKLLFMGRY